MKRCTVSKLDNEMLFALTAVTVSTLGADTVLMLYVTILMILPFLQVILMKYFIL